MIPAVEPMFMEAAERKEDEFGEEGYILLTYLLGFQSSQIVNGKA